MSLKSAVGYLPVSAKELIKRYKDEFLYAMKVYDEPDVTPPIEKVMKAFVGMDTARVVIVGQDPYPKKGVACGLAFATEHGTQMPISIKNIYKCLRESNLITIIPKHSDLSSWAEQGVLLLNTTLTTTIGKSNAHVDQWKPFITKVIEELDKPDMIFILLGKQAQKLVLKNAIRLEWGHPSPVNLVNNTEEPEAFKFCTCFKEANNRLTAMGKAPIDWDSVND